MDYTSLVSKVLQNKHLAKAIDDIVDKEHLNLVDPEWLSRLENNITYQDFLSNSKKLWKPAASNVNYQYEDSKVPNFQVVLVGYCKLGTPYKSNISNKPNLIIMNSEPMAKLARAMTSDLGPDVQISTDFKFSFTDCGLMGCDDCINYAEIFQKSGFKINRHYQPCIADTKIYNGKRVVNRFYSQFENIFQKPFIGILHVEISNRYSFQTGKQTFYRISGNVLNFIGFLENKLTLSKKVDVGPLMCYESEVEKPSLKNKNDIKNSSVATSERDNDMDSFEEFMDDKATVKEESGKRKASDNNVENQEIKKAKLTEEEMIERNNQDNLEDLTDDELQMSQGEIEHLLII